MQKSCTVNGGDTYTYTRAVYKGTAVSADPRLNGAITIHAQSMVDDTTGIGAVIGDYKINAANVPGAFGRIEASLASGQMSGAVRGHAPKPWGELFAGLNGGFDASARLLCRQRRNRQRCRLRRPAPARRVRAHDLPALRLDSS